MQVKLFTAKLTHGYQVKDEDNKNAEALAQLESNVNKTLAKSGLNEVEFKVCCSGHISQITRILAIIRSPVNENF